MADTGKRFTSRTSNIQSRAQQAANQQKQQTASSSSAAKGGSTTTPTVTETPKVTNTAKAMPSITRPDISRIVQQPVVSTPQATRTVDAMNLLGSKTRVEPLKKAETSNILNPSTENKDVQNTTLPLTLVKSAINLGGKVAETVANNLYDQGMSYIKDKIKTLDDTRKNVNETVGNYTVDLFQGIGKDISTQWKEGEGLGMTKDIILNTVQGLPRGIARVEYGLAELTDWAVDAQRATQLKDTIKKDLDYWENTRTYQKIKETEGFSDFLKNPIMYAGGTLTEMLPMFINAWVAVPTTFAQIYGETYSDYSQDDSLKEAGLSDNQIRLMSLGVAGVNTIIELGSDLVQGLMPWTKTIAKTTEKEVRKSLTKPFMKVLSRFVKGGASEGLEEVLQNEMQDQAAGFAGSDRDLPTWADRITTFGISSIIGWILQGGNVVVNVKQNKEIETAFNEWSDAVDKIAPGVSRDDKITLFSSIVAAEVEDANMSDKKVANYEAETTELYNRIDELTEQLNNTTNEEEKQEINRQIEDANQKIKNIDEIINKGNKVVEEVNKQLQELSQKRMEAQQEEETQAALEGLYNEINGIQIEGENLSEQTMKNLPSTLNDYKSFADELHLSQDNMLEKFSIGELLDIKNGAMRMRASSDPESVKTLDFIKNAIDQELKDRYERKKKETKSTDREQASEEEPTVFENAQDYIDKMVDYAEKKRGYKFSKEERKDQEQKYRIRFLQQNLEGDFSKHMFGLKGVNLKQIEGQLTDEKLREVAEMLAKVSNTFGVDFNKVITDKNLSINIANHLGTYIKQPFTVGLMSPKYIKEKLREFFRDTNTRVSEGTIDRLGEDIATAGVSVSLRDGPQRAGEIMSHELWHLIDFAISTEEGLPLVLKKKGRSKERTLAYTSIIDKDKSWKTFKKGDADPRSDVYRYYNDPSEILARYAEQYFAYKNSPESFEKRFAGTEEMKNNKPGEYYNWYWSEEEFLKLLPKFESFIKDRLGAKLLDEENQFYHDIVSKINEGVYDYKNMEYGAEKMNQTELQLKLLQMETNYAWILQTVEGMKGDLKEEMEAYVQLSNLQSNYEMAKAKGEEYLKLLETKPEQQETIDEMTATALPPVETPENPNPVPPQNPSTIRLGLPYYGGSNMENGLDQISKGEEPSDSFIKEYEKEQKGMNKKNRWNWLKEYRRELGQAWSDVFTPAVSRIYNRSPRVAGRLITMETQTQINIHRYRQKAKGFVETLGKLKGKDALEVKMALLDYGALASEQTEETIQEYKEQEVAKLKEILSKYGFKEEDINDMFSVLNDIGQQYKDAGLDIALTDMYFPRVVKDYEGLIDYMSRVSGSDIKVNKTSLLIKIAEIQADPDMTDEEKERRIRNAITIEFKQPGTTSKHGKERKLGLLSEWGPGIYAYYESPIESIDHYIVTMTNAIQRQLFLGGMVKDANITESDILNQSTAESVSTIIGKLVEQGMVKPEDVDVLQKSILAVLNKKPSPKVVTGIKDITYIATITNFLSAINQLDDLGMTILRDRSGLKNIVKAIFGKANIKYDDLGLEDSYEMFREGMGITNRLFKKSYFNAFDRLGKTSFINTAWESLVRQSKNKKTRKYLYERLVAMYGTESADRMMEKIDKNDFRGEDGQMDIEILRDLLYLLGSTQPIYTSSMPVTYLNHPWARLCYALSSFTLKRIDWLVQGTKEVNKKHGKIAAGAWVMGVSFYLALFGAAIGDVGDWLKGKKEDTFLWNFLNKGIDEALKAGGSNALNSWLKIWDLSEYDLKTYKQQGLKGLMLSKISPFIFDLGKDVREAIVERDENEITDLAKYVPIFGKLVYYWCWDDLESTSKKKAEDDERDFSEDEWDFSDEEEWDFSDEDEWDFSDEDVWDFS